MFKEQANRVFDLQFFAEELDLEGEPEEGSGGGGTGEGSEGTPQSKEGTGGQPQEGGEPFTDKVDPSKLSPELQEYYKSMQADYTRKTQEIAPIRKLAKESGMTPEQMVTALQHYQRLNQMTPQELFTALVQRVGVKEARQIVNRLAGDEPPASGQPGPQQPENPFKDDEYAAAIYNKAYEAAKHAAKQEALQEFTSRFGKDLEALKQFKTQTETTIFRSEVDRAIDNILGQYKDSGITREQLFAIAARNGYSPTQMFNAWCDAMGGPEKVQEYFGKRYNAELRKKAEGNAGITKPLGGGKPPGKSKNWADAGWDEIDNSVLEDIAAAEKL